MIGLSKNKSDNFSGLTFIEVLISVFIMGLLVLSATGAASIYLRNRSQLQTTQQAVEELNLIANEISKQMRMSNCDVVNVDACDKLDVLGSAGCANDASSCTAQVRSNETGYLIRYVFNNSGTSPTLTKNVYDSNAASTPIGSPIQMADHIKGLINRKDSSSIPLVIIRLWKTKNDGTIIPLTLVETAVSQRGNYYIDS